MVHRLPSSNQVMACHIPRRWRWRLFHGLRDDHGYHFMVMVNAWWSITMVILNHDYGDYEYGPNQEHGCNNGYNQGYNLGQQRPLMVELMVLSWWTMATCGYHHVLSWLTRITDGRGGLFYHAQCCSILVENKYKILQEPKWRRLSENDYGGQLHA